MGLFENSVFFGVAVSIAAYGLGAFLQSRFKLAVFNPLLISIAVTIIILAVSHIDYDTYYEGARYLSYLLTPATVCLAVPLYEKIDMLKHNWKAIIAGLMSGVLTTLLCILAMSVLFGLSHSEYVTPAKVHHNSHRHGRFSGTGRLFNADSGGHHNYGTHRQYIRTVSLQTVQVDRPHRQRDRYRFILPRHGHVESHGNGRDRRGHEQSFHSGIGDADSSGGFGIRTAHVKGGSGGQQPEQGSSVRRCTGPSMALPEKRQCSLRSLFSLRLCLETDPNELASCGRSHVRVPWFQTEWNSPLRSILRIADGSPGQKGNKAHQNIAV